MNELFDKFCENDSELKKCLSFIIEIDKMKDIERRSLTYSGTHHENDAEHSYHLAIMALMLEKFASAPVDMLRVIKMVLVHDMVEIYAGDTYAFDKAANLDKEKREAQAALKLFTDIPNGEEFKALWEEFDRADTDDSLYAAALDRLQPFISNYLNAGGTWVLNGVSEEDILKRMEPISRGIPKLWGLILSIVTDCEGKGLIKK